MKTGDTGYLKLNKSSKNVFTNGVEGVSVRNDYERVFLCKIGRKILLVRSVGLS